MNDITKSMFESIKSALVRQESNNSSYRDILKMESDKTYVVRLLPNIKDPSKTFFHFFQHSWNSFATGKFLSTVSPSTFGERDPISELKYKMLRSGSEEDKKKAGSLVWSERWLVNAFIVDDPTNPDNNGKVKIIQFGKQLHKIIMRAIDGDDAEDLGPRVFSLKSDGVNLKIVCESQGGYKTYTSSKFSMPKAIDGLDAKAIDSVLNNIHDLEKINPVKSYDDLKKVLDEHFLCVESTDTAEPALTRPASTREPVLAAANISSSDSSSVDDEEVKRLLDGIDE
jgi:hypothetical protein